MEIMSAPEEVTATIRMIGQEMDSLEVPAHLLVRTLESLQNIVYLLATFQEKQTIGKRFRVKDEIQQLYTLRCQVAQSGSYAIPISLKPSTNSQITAFTNYLKIIDNFAKIFRAITENNLGSINEILPDSNLRYRLLREIRKLTPKAGENWKLGFSSKDVPEFIVTEDSNSYIDGWLSIDTPEDQVMTVTGELIRIDFDKRTVAIKYPPTHQEIECIYLEELEYDLIENRRQLIQVTGKFTLNSDGHPIKLTDVTRIEPVDLSSILLKEVSYGKTKLKFKQPLRLIPRMDEDSSQLLILEEPSINLQVFAYSREDLIHEINEQIIMMWDEYVKENSELLAPDAKVLKNSLLAILEEID